MGVLSTGSWLSRGRAMRIAIVCGLVSICILTFLIVSSTGTLDYLRRPIGTDYSQVWTAGRMTLSGHAADVWNWDRHFAFQRAFHGPALAEYYGWHYPPPFLLIAATLATLPYLPSLALWQAATLIPFVGLIRRITGRSEAWFSPGPVSLFASCTA